MTLADEPNATAWWQWLSTHLDLARMTPAELVRRSNGGITKSAVSVWKAGKSGVNPDKAILAARILGGSPVEALRAAGHNSLADLIDPATLSAALPSPDPNVAEIMGWTHLSVSVREVLLRQYRRGQQAALEQARTTARLLTERDGNGDSDSPAA